MIRNQQEKREKVIRNQQERREKVIRNQQEGRDHFAYLCPTMITCVFYLTSFFCWAEHELYFLQPVCKSLVRNFGGSEIGERREKFAYICPTMIACCFYNKQVIFVGQTIAFHHQLGVWVCYCFVKGTVA